MCDRPDTETIGHVCISKAGQVTVRRYPKMVCSSCIGSSVPINVIIESEEHLAQMIETLNKLRTA